MYIKLCQSVDLYDIFTHSSTHIVIQCLEVMVSWLHESVVWSLPQKTRSLWVSSHPPTRSRIIESLVKTYTFIIYIRHIYSHYELIKRYLKKRVIFFETNHFQKTFWTTFYGKFRALPPQHLPRWQVIEFLFCLPHHETLQHRFTLCDGARTPRADAGTRFLTGGSSLEWDFHPGLLNKDPLRIIIYENPLLVPV